MVKELGLPPLRVDQADYIHNPELQQRVRKTQIGVLALSRVYEQHIALGDKGRDIIPKADYPALGITNHHDSNVLVADFQAERTILNTVNEFMTNVQSRGEETGDRGFDQPNVEDTAIMDGLDGSIVYTESLGSYGTMLDFMDGDDPTYNDYSFCGIVDLTRGKIYFAAKGLGAYKLNLKDGEITQINSDQKSTHLEEGTQLLADLKFDEVYGKTVITDLIKDKFKMLKKAPRTSGSSAANFMDLADEHRGKGWRIWREKPVGSIDCQRKMNLENAVAYGLMREAGGVMVTVDDNGQVVDLGAQKYLTFAQEKNDHRPVVTAVNVPMADAITNELGLSRPGEVIEIFSRTDHPQAA
jgi:fructose-1,6-bisphosphatase/inositol monophosphatase family enzyme